MFEMCQVIAKACEINPNNHSTVIIYKIITVSRIITICCDIIANKLNIITTVCKIVAMSRIIARICDSVAMSYMIAVTCHIIPTTNIIAITCNAFAISSIVAITCRLLQYVPWLQ